MTADGGAAPRLQEAGHPCPKIELHVHFEGTVSPRILFEIARRNDVPLPADTVEGLSDRYRFRDFRQFIEIWMMAAAALRRAEDFRQVVVEYAAEAAGHGAVYIEGIFAPGDMVRREIAWEEIFDGYCEGALEARERHGVEVRLTPDITRGLPHEVALETARTAVRYAERGVVGLGLGGLEADFPPELYAEVFALARDGGLAAVPHAGEVGGAASVKGAIEALQAQRIRHGIRAVDDAGVVRELVDRGTVLDVCPISNLRTGAVASLAEHPLPRLLDAGLRCSLSTDDPAMFGTNLGNEYEVGARLGLSPAAAFEAGLAGALCDERTRGRLRSIGDKFAW